MTVFSVFRGINFGATTDMPLCRAMMPGTVTLPFPTPLLDIVVLGTAAVTISKGFDWVEDALSPEGKIAIYSWLMNRSEGSHVSDWSTAFLKRIDQVFGKKPFSFKFFLRSSF